MKKILAFALCALMLVSMLALVGCGEKKTDKNDDTNKPAAAVKFGFGVSTKGAANNDKGEASLEATYAAVLVDADGKIVDVKLDAVSMTTKLTDGALQLLANKKDLKSKYEQGDEYAMKNEFYGSKEEWYVHADAFLSLVPGKTADEVLGLVVNGYKGNDEVIAAGCTIGVNDFAVAIANACANAKTEVAADAKLSVSSVGSEKEKDGVITFTTDIAGAAKDANGKILAITSDCVTFDFALDAEGAIFVKVDDEAHAKMSKRQRGDSYGMSKIGKTEWDKQADVFNNACIGKTAAEIAGLAKEDGYGVDAVYSAGCTIHMSGLVAAAAKL